MDERERTLRRLALHDDDVIRSILAVDTGTWKVSCIDPRTHALVRLGALIALDAPVVAYQACTATAVAAGATADDIVDALIAVAPLTGEARLVAAASALALAIGYDIDAALEAYDGGIPRRGDP
ncbi:MAG TPA: carboxymuconolactone decarboxylase family protein [Euzebyales bacterium]|nr:carboxymuconolactone decarboxylase family protein [Euzebyales bacterium]